jgi:hypothetical protein
VKKKYNLAELVSSKESFEFGGLQFARTGSHYEAKTSENFEVQLYDALKSTGKIMVYVAAYFGGAKTQRSVQRKLKRMARSVGLDADDYSLGEIEIIIKSKADERRFASFVPTLWGRKIRRTIVASGYSGSYWI